MRRRPSSFYRRAHSIFMLTALIPTVLMAAVGIIFLAEGGSKSMAVVGGILVLAFCATALAGCILGTIFVTRGATPRRACRTSFCRRVSHELRTPLTSIRLFIDIAARRPPHRRRPRRSAACALAQRADPPRWPRRQADRAVASLESRRDVFERARVEVAPSSRRRSPRSMVQTLISQPTSRSTSSVEPGLVVCRRPRDAGPARRESADQRLEVHASDDKRIGVDRARPTGATIYISVSDNGIGIAAGEQQLDLRAVSAAAAAARDERRARASASASRSCAPSSTRTTGKLDFDVGGRPASTASASASPPPRPGDRDERSGRRSDHWPHPDRRGRRRHRRPASRSNLKLAGLPHRIARDGETRDSTDRRGPRPRPARHQPAQEERPRGARRRCATTDNLVPVIVLSAREGRVRQGRRAPPRRRRLRDQAVRAGRAARAHRRRCCAARAARSRRRRHRQPTAPSRPPPIRFGDVEIDLAAARP